MPIPDWATAMVTNYRSMVPGGCPHVTDEQIFALEQEVGAMDDKDAIMTEELETLEFNALHGKPFPSIVGP